jgi:formate-dependent phosphoribosylglycinamide formyltransferase (GAR transformylase)
MGELDDVRIVTASAYAGMMEPLTRLASAACSLTGDTDTDGQKRHVSPLSLEALDGVRRRWRLEDLGRLADFVPKVVARAQADPQPVVVVPPRVSVAWEAAASTWPEHIRLLGPPARELATLADDKIFVRRELHRLGVPVPEAVVVAAGDLSGSYHRLARRLGVPFVAQTPQGAGGRGTYLVDSDGQLGAAVAQCPQVEQWLVSAYAGDVTINVAGVAHAAGVTLAPASVQSSGITEIGGGFGAYCGSDFGAAAGVDPIALASAYRYAHRVGAWLHDRGHRGIFGADVAVRGREVSFLEVNPRIQGSSWLLSGLQRRRGRPECLVEHVRSLLGHPAIDDRAAPSDLGPGAHLLVRWTGPGGVVHAVPTAGSHRILGPGTPVTVSGLPRVGTLLAPGAIVARLESTDSLTTPAGSALRPDVADLVSRLRSAIELSPITASQDSGKSAGLAAYATIHAGSTWRKTMLGPQVVGDEP